MGCKWPYSCCFMGCLFNIACSILGKFPFSVFSMHFVSVLMVYLYSSIDTTAGWKKSRFIVSVRSDFHMIDSLSVAVHAFARCISTSLTVDEILLPRYMNLSTNSRGPPFNVEMVRSLLKQIYSVLFAFTWRPIPSGACFSRDSLLVGVFARNAILSV